MDIDKFETIKDFQQGFIVLANACAKKFGGDKLEVRVYEDNQVCIEFR